MYSFLDFSWNISDTLYNIINSFNIKFFVFINLNSFKEKGKF